MAFVRVARLVTKLEVFSELPKKPVSASILSRTAHAAKTSLSGSGTSVLTSMMPTEKLVILWRFVSSDNFSVPKRRRDIGP